MNNVVQMRDSLINFVMGLGTNKDSRTASTYNFAQLDPTQLEAAFRSDWIARKVVMAPAEDATREWREWQTSQKQIEKLENYEKKLGLQQKLRRAVWLARLYGGAGIVLGVPIGRAEEPLDYADVGPDELKFVEPFHQFELTPGQRITDINSPWFNRPEYYQLGTDTTNVNKNEGAGGVRIHPSRVIPLVGAEIPDPRRVGSVWGDSVLQAVDDAIKATGHVVGGIATMVVDAKLDVIHIPGLTEKLSNSTSASKLLERFTLANQAKSTVNALLLDEKETWERINTSFGSLPQLIQEYLTLASGAAGIPVSRLLGQSRGKGLGGSEGGGEVDTRNYYDGISSMQRNELTPVLTPLDDVLVRAALGTDDESIYYEWTPLWQLSDTEKATIASQKATAAQADVTMALINPDVLRKSRINQLIEDGTYPGIEDAIDEFGAEPEEPATPSPEDVQAHIGMMQKSAGALKGIAKSAGLDNPSTTKKGSVT